MENMKHKLLKVMALADSLRALGHSVEVLAVGEGFVVKVVKRDYVRLVA